MFTKKGLNAVNGTHQRIKNSTTLHLIQQPVLAFISSFFSVAQIAKVFASGARAVELGQLKASYTLHTCTLAHLHTLHTCTMHTCKVNYGLILNMSIYQQAVSITETKLISNLFLKATHKFLKNLFRSGHWLFCSCIGSFIPVSGHYQTGLLTDPLINTKTMKMMLTELETAMLAALTQQGSSTLLHISLCPL